MASKVSLDTPMKQIESFVDKAAADPEASKETRANDSPSPLVLFKPFFLLTTVILMASW